MPTSSANPDKLQSYSADGLDLLGTLRTRSNAVTDALATLRASSSHHVPALGDVDERLSDLVDDWLHLDEFVGDVGQGFAAADYDAGGNPSGVVTVDDGTLAALGEIGFADRDEAIAAANEMADELDRMQEEGATPEEIDAFIDMASRGQYDPAFAVTFSERVGVDGYADATAMIRAAYFGTGDEGNGPIPNVQVLSTMLTTALDTLPGIDEADRHDPSNAALADEDRLGADFVHDLTTGYQPDGSGGWWNGTGPDDLSVVIGLSDPPTAVAVEIAENRMKPLLEDPGSLLNDASWWAGEGYGDPVVNYASMLGRNDDASARWLGGEDNLELVLTHPGDDRADGGAALARVVEAGLTNPDLRLPVPGAPSYAEGPLAREALMDRAIDFIGGQDGAYDVDNPYLFDALASGVESNMTLIDDRINDGWSASGENYVYAGGDELPNTMYFLSDVMADDDAAERIRSATIDYVDGELAGLEVDEDGYRPRDDVHEAGRMLGTVMEAELAAIDEAFGDDLESSGRAQKVTNFVTGWIPVAGEANSFADLAGVSVGELTSPSPSFDEHQADVQEAVLAAEEAAEGRDLLGRDLDSLSAAAGDVREEIARDAQDR